jgi:hypothetical protein
MAAYSAWNSAPSRLSHSSSDGVNGRGAEQIAGLGLGEEVDAEADEVSPVVVERFAMLLGESVKRLGAECKYLAAAACAQGRWALEPRRRQPAASSFGSMRFFRVFHSLSPAMFDDRLRYAPAKPVIKVGWEPQGCVHFGPGFAHAWPQPS